MARKRTQNNELDSSKGGTTKNAPRSVTQKSVKSGQFFVNVSKSGKAPIYKEVNASRRMAIGVSFIGAEPSISERVAAAREVREGLAFSEVESLLNANDLSAETLIDSGVLPRRTWLHARSEGRISPNVAQKISRLIRISALARETFGPEKAALWLKRPTKALDGESPLSLLDTDEGARAVETLIGRIAHGIAA